MNTSSKVSQMRMFSAHQKAFAIALPFSDPDLHQTAAFYEPECCRFFAEYILVKGLLIYGKSFDG